MGLLMGRPHQSNLAHLHDGSHSPWTRAVPASRHKGHNPHPVAAKF